MNNDVIGFKLADGSFYPVFEEGAAVEKQLELTTVRDDQTTIQLHIYKSPSGSMEDAQYVETLLLENLMPHPKEEASLALKIALDDDNNLSAEIIDSETGLSTSTKVSLVTLDEATLHGEIPDDFTLSGENLDTFAFDPSEPDSAEASDDFSVSDSLPADDDFSLPEESVQEASFDIDFSDSSFDTSDLDDVSTGLPETDTDSLFSYDDIPDFGDIPEETASDSVSSDTFSIDDLDPGYPLASPFAGDEDFFQEEERRSQRKFRIPVIICIVCAVISVIVLAIILFLTPSRLKGKAESDIADNLIPAVEIAEPAEDHKIEDLTKARDNEVVVSPVPVVPEVPKKAEPVAAPEPVKAPEPVAAVPAAPAVTTTAAAKKEPQSVRYRLKWGDTLWDLAETYYRNPWQYKKIARWNGIKNPDYIIAGTYIYIPE